MKRIEVNSITNISLVRAFNIDNYNNNFTIVMTKVVGDQVITLTGITDPNFNDNCRGFIRVPIDLIGNTADGGEYIVEVYCESIEDGMTLVSSLVIEVVTDEINNIAAGDPIYGNTVKYENL